MLPLSRDRAGIFRITHVDNVEQAGHATPVAARPEYYF
jgi:hypothetical protein